MFGLFSRTSRESFGRAPRKRARDGHTFRSASLRRRQRKAVGLTGKQQRRAINEHRRYRKGKQSF